MESVVVESVELLVALDALLVTEDSDTQSLRRLDLLGVTRLANRQGEPTGT